MMEHKFRRLWEWRLEIDLVAIIKNIAKYDKDAFTVLYKHLYQDIVKLAFVKTHDYHAAQDIAQETFMNVWTKARSFHCEGNRNSMARAWIYTIARNLVVDHWRNGKHEMAVGEIELQNEVLSQRELDMLHERMDVYSLVETLPRDYADVVVLHTLGAFTIPECAAQLRISTASVKRKCRAGIDLLIKTIESQQASPQREDEILGGGGRDDVLA